MSQSYLRFAVKLVGIIAWSTNAMAQESSSAFPIPPPGELVDLGGWRLHLHCSGENRPNQPTVILEAGAAGFSVDWSLVQPEVAKFARVCAYDRAGLGWSELGPHPRTLRQTVWELHTLLRTANVQPPYLLAGHSAGGILARLYTFTFPNDVSGIVFDESGHERGVMVMRNGRLVRLVDVATSRAVPDVKTSAPLKENQIPVGARGQIEVTARALGPRANKPPRDKLPVDAQRMRAWSFSQIKHWATNDNPFEAEELAALLTRWTAQPHQLGDMPIVVLSRGRAEAKDTAVEEEHRRNQAELLTLSRASRQVIANRSGHLILVDQPEIVVEAIRAVLNAVDRPRKP